MVYYSIAKKTISGRECGLPHTRRIKQEGEKR